MQLSSPETKAHRTVPSFVSMNINMSFCGKKLHFLEGPRVGLQGTAHTKQFPTRLTCSASHRHESRSGAKHGLRPTEKSLSLEICDTSTDTAHVSTRAYIHLPGEESAAVLTMQDTGFPVQAVVIAKVCKRKERAAFRPPS